MVTAFVWGNVELGYEEKVVEELQRRPEISEARLVMGVYDFVARVQARDLPELKKYISGSEGYQGIRQLKGIRSTFTDIIIESIIKEPAR